MNSREDWTSTWRRDNGGLPTETDHKSRKQGQYLRQHHKRFPSPCCPQLPLPTAGESLDGLWAGADLLLLLCSPEGSDAPGGLETLTAVWEPSPSHLAVLPEGSSAPARGDSDSRASCGVPALLLAPRVPALSPVG